MQPIVYRLSRLAACHAGARGLGIEEDLASGERGVRRKGCGAISLRPTLREKPRRMGHPLL